MRQLVVATKNDKKLYELRRYLRSVKAEVVSLNEFEKTPRIVEDGNTFKANAIKKATVVSRFTHGLAIADDSGLVVDALNGAPGVISARYAGFGASDQDNLYKLLKELEGAPENQRSARFICVMVFMEHADDPFPVIAQGVWEGRILNHPIGNNGFGYDPVFWVPGYNCASAELTAAVKNSLSHRGRALRSLTELIRARELS